MDISQKQLKHCDLVKITGRVDSATAPQVSDVLKTITENGRYKIVIDCTDMEFISSAGLWVLVNVQKTCKRYNRGEIILAGVSTRIQSSLDLAGFIPYFTIAEDPIEGVGLF